MVVLAEVMVAVVEAAEYAVEGTDRNQAVPSAYLGMVEIVAIYPPFSLLHPKD